MHPLQEQLEMGKFFIYFFFIYFYKLMKKKYTLSLKQKKKHI